MKAKIFAFTAQRVCPETKNFKKCPHKKKKNIAIPKGIRDTYLAKQDLPVSWRIGPPFFDAGEICELRLDTVTCLTSIYVGKQHQTTKDRQKPCKMVMH